MLGEHADHKINSLRGRLVYSNARSAFVNAHPKKSWIKMDLLSLAQLSESNWVDGLLEQFLFNPSFSISLNNKLKINDREYKKTVHLHRKNEDFKNEFNIDPLGLGYPLLIIESKNKKNTNSPPIHMGRILKKIINRNIHLFVSN